MTDDKSTSDNAKPADRNVLVYALGALAVVVAVVAALLAWQWRSAANDLDELHAQNADRDKAAEVAKDYAVRSLTYDYRNLNGFFDGVRNGASETLQNRYNEVRDTLTKIMTESQVVATGDVVATAVAPPANGKYAVTVFATQKTQNVQQPDPGSVPNLLVVTVAKDGDNWQVVDYGPK